MARCRVVFSLGVLLLALGCRSSNGPPGSGGTSAPPSTAAPPSTQATVDDPAPVRSADPVPSRLPEPSPPELPPKLSGESLQDLPVPGYGAAVVSVPLGAREPRPVVLALHGNYDRPEWQCEVWRAITGGFPWVLCPRGVPRSDAPKSEDRWTYTTAAKVGDEVRAALAALAGGFPKHVDAEAPIFTGFSLGAILGVHLLSGDALPLVRSAVLIEGGYGGWHVPRIKAFAAKGGVRVLFACGQSACRHASKQTGQLMQKHGVSVDVASGGDIGHTYGEAVADAIQTRWTWVTEIDPRFAPPPNRTPQ